MGLRIALADVNVSMLNDAAKEVAAAAPGGSTNVLAVPTDVSKIEEVERLRDAVLEKWGEVSR